jgi:hypothetical protein
VKQAHQDLQRRIAALRTRFAEVGARAAAASRALQGASPPPDRLLQELSDVGAEFNVLRAAILEEAAVLSRPPAASSITRLRDLESVTAAVIAAEEERGKRAAWDVARESASSVLDRAQTVIHREDRDFAGLAECKAKAREIQASLAGTPPADVGQQTANLDTRLRPFVALVTLIEGWNRLDDERCASLQDVIAQAFGRPLGLAALRGKLGYEGEAPSAPERTAPAERAKPPSRLFSAAAAGPVAAEPAAAPAPAAPPPPPPVIEPPIPLPPTVERRPPAPARFDEPWNAPPDSAEVEIRLNSDQVHVETPEERREREALLERLAAKNAQWWVRARTAFNALVTRNVTPANAAREMLAKYPYLLSVPLLKSVDFAGGKLAEGYAILLQRIEKEEAGFVESALTRLNPQFTTGGKSDSYPLGQELYLYVVAQGRLYKTYPEFVKDVLGHVTPEPGVWLQGSMTVDDDEVQVLTNLTSPGGGVADTRKLTNPRDRGAEQVFSVSTGPLTTRVFSVETDKLKVATDVEIKLKEGDTASDKAWIIPTPMTGKPEAPRRHKAGGTTIEAFGKDFRTILVAVFNSDPNSEKRYDLAITLKSKTPPPGAAKAAAAAPKQSPFAPKRS